MLRFAHNAPKEENKISSLLSSTEFQKVEQTWIQRISQSECFTAEISKLKEGKVFGNFIPYHPFFDKWGVVCVGRQTAKADLPKCAQSNHPPWQA